MKGSGFKGGQAYTFGMGTLDPSVSSWLGPTSSQSCKSGVFIVLYPTECWVVCGCCVVLPFLDGMMRIKDGCFPPGLCISYSLPSFLSLPMGGSPARAPCLPLPLTCTSVPARGCPTCMVAHRDWLGRTCFIPSNSRRLGRGHAPADTLDGHQRPPSWERRIKHHGHQASLPSVTAVLRRETETASESRLVCNSRV